MMSTGQDHELKRILDEAFRAFEAGDDINARRLCRDALAIDPDSGTAHSLLGLLYEREGKQNDASHEFTKVVSQNPDSEAERQTLARLRGLPIDQQEFVEERSNGLIIAVAAVVALLVFGGIFAAFRAVRGLPGPAASTDQRVASADIDADLELARQAFSSGRYDAAMKAADRVLQAQPTNSTAREIYDRSEAFLRGTEQPPVSRPSSPAPQVVGPAEPADVRSTPAVPAPAAAAPRAAAPAVGPVTPRAVVPPATVAPPAPAAPGALPSISAPAGGVGVPAARPAQVRDVLNPTLPNRTRGYDTTARTRANTPGSVTPPRRPPVQSGYGQPEATGTVRPDRPQPVPTTGGADVRVDQEDSYVHIEVTPRRRPSDTAAPEVTPGTSTAPAGTTGTAPAPDPTATRYQERQQQLREFRERQKALEARRSEREQGQ